MTDLSQHLHELVDRVPVGPAPIQTMTQARQRPRTFAAAAAGSAVAAAAVTAIMLATTNAHEAPSPAPAGEPTAPFTASPDHLAPPVRTKSTLGAPTKLPPIASLNGRWSFSTGSVVHEYRLAGPANADTATPEAIAAEPRSPAVHTATYLSVHYIPGVNKLDVPADPAYFNIETVDVNGAEGKLTTSKNGLGVIRLDWVDKAGIYHVVMVDRQQTSDGISGLSADEILAVGRSVR